MKIRKSQLQWLQKHFFLFKCPCEEKKCHLGIFAIVPGEAETPTELSKVQKELNLGHGIKETDPIKAAKIFLNRDHDKLVALLSKYFPGKLGVYMVPRPCFMPKFQKL